MADITYVPPPRRTRCVQPPGGGVVDGQSPAHRTGARRAGHGGRTTTPGLGHPSLRPAANTRHWPSVNAAASGAWHRRWARSGTVTTTPWRRASSPLWSASCLSAPIIAKHRGQSSSSSKDGITRTVATRGWAITHPWTSRGAIGKLHETQDINRPLKRIFTSPRPGSGAGRLSSSRAGARAHGCAAARRCGSTSLSLAVTMRVYIAAASCRGRDRLLGRLHNDRDKPCA